MDPSLESDLKTWLSPAILKVWRRRGVESLLPLQRRALHQTGLIAGHNLLVLAPSSSGKSIIGELALFRALASGRRALFLSPTRALAEQHYAALERALSGTGWRVVCSTSDRPESDARVAAGRFDILVAVFEKLRGFLAADSRLLAAVGTVVADEIQTLDDPQRGPWLDLLLTQILRSPYAPQLVALGPPLSAPGRLASWLGAELLECSRRPHPLREGVLVTSSGRFHYRCANGEREDTAFQAARAESWGPAGRLAALEYEVREAAQARSVPLSDEAPHLLAAAVQAAIQRGPAILFAPTRHCSRRWVRLLTAMRLPFPPARVGLGALEQSSAAGRIRRGLRDGLASGVAFHNADLSVDLRELVESAFESGEIRLLVSTPTLGLGVNLSARTVLHTPWRMGCALELGGSATARAEPTDTFHRRWQSVALPLGRARFSQQGGRAGRLGYGFSPGHSVLVARSEEEARRLWDQFVAAPPESMKRPPLASFPLQEAALGLLAGGTRRTTANLAREWTATFSGHLEADGAKPADEAAVEAAMRELERRGFVRQGEDRLWGVTGRGETAIRASLPPSTLEQLERAGDETFEGERGRTGRECGFLFRLALTPEGEQAAASLPFFRRRPPLPLPAGMEAEDVDTVLPPGAMAQGGGFSSAEVRAWCAASVLCDWSQGMETSSLEAKYDVHAGSVAGAGESMARLVLASAGLGRVLEWRREAVHSLGELADRLIHGVDSSGLALARLRVRGLGREAIARLVSKGCGDPARISVVSPAELECWVGSDLVPRLRTACATGFTRRSSDARQQAAHARPASGRAPAGSAPAGESHAVSAESAPPLLEINLQSPGIVYASGFEVRLPPLGFDLLVALAERPGEVVTRSALYHRLWPEGGPEEQQLDAHRRRLLARLRPPLGRDAVYVGEVVRGVGFRLALDPSQVQVHRVSPPRRKSGCAGRPSPG